MSVSSTLGVTFTLANGDRQTLPNLAGETRLISILQGYGFLYADSAGATLSQGGVRLDQSDERNVETTFSLAGAIFVASSSPTIFTLSDPITASGGGGGSGGAVTIANGADIAEGNTANTAWDTVAASATVIAILKRIAIKGTAQPIVNGAIVLGGVAQSIAANTLRKGFEIVSLEPLGGSDIWIQHGGVAAIGVGFPLFPGGSYSTKENAIYPGVISIFSTTTGAQFAYSEII